MKGKDISWYIDQAIRDNYLIAVLVTSAAEGKISSLGMDFGAGKSTLMLQIAHLYLGSWDKVFQVLHYFPWELEEFFSTAPRRKPGTPVFFLYDDIQMTLGKDKSSDPYVRNLRNRLSTARPQLSVFFATAPDISQIAKPFRTIFTFIIICPRRGVYEVQRLKKYAPFKSPYRIDAVLSYSGETTEIGFSQLPDDIQKRYEEWRDARNKEYDSGEGDLRIGSVRRVLPDSAIELLEHIVKKGTLTRQHVITILDRGSELKLLKATGMVETFEDNLVPSRNASRLLKILHTRG